jgi:hypothetical protein
MDTGADILSSAFLVRRPLSNNVRFAMRHMTLVDVASISSMKALRLESERD